ncbi:hypothetical protein E2562_006045 [Oryza meyeriana var. granulata]|uniref:DUF834 domain-containing protein n=1 Tax=Oryza meyeriana var. granulata TaxID=110450 RepID=A0A6G1EVD9_9ORYZ|nr:hypothetical protein E2562_006045 [Oryza meyeriana var. granulata]
MEGIEDEERAEGPWRWEPEVVFLFLRGAGGGCGNDDNGIRGGGGRSGIGAGGEISSSSYGVPLRSMAGDARQRQRPARDGVRMPPEGEGGARCMAAVGRRGWCRAATRQGPHHRIRRCGSACRRRREPKEYG